MTRYMPRHAARRDGNEARLIRQLEDVPGLLVTRLDPKDEPGLPDLLVVYRGRTALVEVKTKSGKVADAQAKFIKRVVDAGGTAFVARTVEDVLRGLGVMYG